MNSKIKLQLIQDTTHKYEVIGFAETLTNCFSEGEFESFEIFTGVDKDKLKCHHGIALLVKSDLSHEFFETNLGLWAKLYIEKVTYLFGVVYMPCESSKYRRKDMFETFFEELIGMKTVNDTVFIMGDFNARTGEKFDYISLDDETPALPIRKNRDKKVNNNGRQLVDSCKTTDFIILNGRTGSDRNIGEYTCLNYNGRSAVDYMIVDHSLFDQVCNFKVKCSDPGLSDVHCALHCEIDLSRSSSSSNTTDNDVEPLVKKSGMITSKKT